MGVRDQFRLGGGGWGQLPEYFLHCLPEYQVVLPEYYMIFFFFWPENWYLKNSRGGGAAARPPPPPPPRTLLEKGSLAVPQVEPVKVL